MILRRLSGFLDSVDDSCIPISLKPGIAEDIECWGTLGVGVSVYFPTKVGDVFISSWALRGMDQS